MNSKFVVLKFKDSLYCYKCQVDMQNTPLTLAIVPILPLGHKFLALINANRLGSRLCGNGGTPAQFFGTNYFFAEPLVGTGNQIPVVVSTVNFFVNTGTGTD